MSLCRDHDEDCPSIFAEGNAMKCWLYDPDKGFCPYLRSTGSEPEHTRATEPQEPERG
jgi:hypothetical protein